MSKISLLLLYLCLLQMMITPIQGGLIYIVSCQSDQNKITSYSESDRVTQSIGSGICLKNADWGVDFYCSNQKYFINSTTGLYDCIQCDLSHSFPIMLDSGRNFCGIKTNAIYNQDCLLYADQNPQFFTTNKFTLYKCKTCPDSTYNLINVQNFLYDVYSTSLTNTLCTKLPLISGKTGGQSCLTYEASSYQYDTTGTLTNNLKYLVCGQCKTTAVSMDCSFACAVNEYEIKYLSAGSLLSICVSGGGTQGWDNSYVNGYTYECEIYESYDSVNQVLGKCLSKKLTSQCLQYDPILLTKCIRCTQYYYLNYQQNICIPAVLLCSSYLGTMCIQCIQPYELVNQTCIIRAANCDIYNTSNGNCSKCKNQYFLNSFMKCDPYKVCQNYQYLNTSINECQEGQIQNCLIYFNNGFQCSQCQANYRMDSLGFSCKHVPSLAMCPNNTDIIKYVIFFGKCVSVDVNCKYYLEGGYCYQCIDGYYQFKGSCYLNSQTTGFPTSQTIFCQNDQYLVEGNCIKIPINCLFFDRQSNTCRTCAQGYILNPNQTSLDICTQITN